MPDHRVTSEEREVLLRLALGRDGWDERIESRFVHRVTGEAIDIFDARVHGSIFDWRTEERRVFETAWEATDA